MNPIAKKEPENVKDRWDKWHIIANTFAVVAIPILVAWFGSQINATVKDKEISQRYVELAIGILKDDPKNQSPALREWAINIVNAKSPVGLNKTVRDELKKTPIRAVRTIIPKESSKVMTYDNGQPITYDNGEPVTFGNGEPVTFGSEPVTLGKGPPVVPGTKLTPPGAKSKR